MTYFESYFQNAVTTMSRTATMLVEIEVAANKVLNCIQNGGTLFVCGNGGSASDAQHIAAELVGRFRSNRKALAAVCLNTDTSALTAIANDFGYEEVFSRQLEGLAKQGDLLIAISTSGNSKNILRALQKASEIGLETILFTGGNGGEALEYSTMSLTVKSNETCHIQESHIAIGQAICGFVEEAYL